GERAARVRAAGGRAGEARDGRGGQARPVRDARAGGGGAGGPGRLGGLRRGSAGVLREARAGLRGPVTNPRPASEKGQTPFSGSRTRTGPDAVVRARIAKAGAGSGEPICAENRPRRLLLGYTR